MPQILITTDVRNQVRHQIIWPRASATTDLGGQVKNKTRNAPALCRQHQDELNARAVEVADAFDTWIADEDSTARPGVKDSMHALLDACSELTMAL